MKTLLLILWLPLEAIAQTMTQDAEGKSSVLYYGGAIGLDLSKPRLSLSYSNLGTLRDKVTDAPSFVWGVNAYGSNSDNTANLFTKGEFQPEAGLFGIAGLRFRFDKESGTISRYKKKKEELQMERLKNISRIETLSGPGKTKLEARNVELKKIIDELGDRIGAEQSQLRRRVLLMYSRAGRTESAFKLSLAGTDPAGFSTVFSDESFGGNTASFGANYEVGMFLYGFEIGTELTNNVKDLSSKSYTITTTQIVGNQTLESKKNITAYSGADYRQYQQRFVNVDLIAFMPLRQHNYVAWNLYARNKNFAKADNSGPINFTNIGLGAYFFNMENKFLGGIYVEAPDAFQNKEKVLESPNLQNRLTFGVVARFNFASIVGPTF